MHVPQEDSDEVVFEGDIFLSKALAENLYIFQYPTNVNSGEKADEESSCLSARIKPKQQKVEMELGIDIHSDSYDRGRGERIACEVDGKDNANNAFFQSEYMDKYIMQGSKSVGSSESYGLGLLKKGELHLVPLHSVISMTPHCVHIDKMDSQAKKVNPVDEEEEEEAVAVTVRFEGANTDKNKEFREKTHQYYQHMTASEPWINLDYYPINSNRSKLECQKLLCTDTCKENVNEFLEPQDYLKNLVPSHLQSSHEDVKVDRFIKDKSVSDQIKYILTNAHLLTYSMLVEKLTCKVDEATVERLLNQFAVLVRGCWAVKSELLYPENYVSAFTGVHSKTLVNTRDYILWLFTKSAVITRQEVLSVIQIPGVDFKSMITPLAIEVDRCWEFKFPEDKEFIDSHAEVTERQNMKWDLRYKKLVKDLNIGMQEMEGLTASPSKVPPYAITSRPRQKRHSRSSVSEGDESGTDSAHGTKESHKTKRSCSFKRNTNANSSNLSSKSKHSHFASFDNSSILESLLPANLMAELKEYVGDIMRTQYCMTLKDIKELVSQCHLSGIANRGDFEKLVEQALVESGAQELKNKWPQNAVPETLYAFTKFDSKLDRYRNALLDLFCSVARTRMNMLVKKVEDELREVVSEADCRLLFEEYCVYKSGFYYLKGTIALDS